MTSKIEAKRQGIGAPDGWCAYRPDGAAHSVGLAKEGCEQRMTGVDPRGFTEHSMYRRLLESEVEKALEIGWQIKPVKIIPHDTWERLVVHALDYAEQAENDNVDGQVARLKEILAEVEK